MQYKDPYIEICIEGQNSIFKGLPQADKEQIDTHHEVAYYRKGDVMVREGARTHGLVCLASGKAKVFKVGAGQREQIIRMLRPQNFISYRSLFSENQYPFTVTAIEDSAIVIFEKHCMSRILKQNAELATKFIKAISEELLYSNNRLISLTQKHVRGRIAESILLLRDTYGVEVDGRTLRVLITREDMAHLSNMTTSNAIRTLSGFAAEGLVGLDGRKIIILDVDMLESISESGQ
jgi:CRP/FNR family transcriptional regulator, polysaccharide utilization system transcription regulator